MARTSDRDIFLRQLKKLSGKNNDFVSNQRVREELKWDQERYRAIHRALNQEGRIVGRRGWHGGSVALSASLTEADKLSVFISYSHVDAELKDRLLKHLKPLERLNLIKPWVDHSILPGDDWDRKITEKLSKADIVLLLISVDFINSEYCYDNELEKAIEREEKGQTKIIPVILRNCLWKDSPLIGRFKALPTDGKAVSAWSDIDEALTVVAQGIRDAANALLEEI